ncbi:MAG: zinc ribbon domain-containing protein [Gammaproteobacteria bacterium]
MPIFDYQCSACGHTFDVLQKVGEGALRKCPECGKLTLKKQLAAPNFHLKGTGWYKTDFRDKAGAKADKKAESDAKGGNDKSAAEKSTDKSGGKSEKAGHSLDSGSSHKHDHGHSHSHGGHTHSHGPGGHKH